MSTFKSKAVLYPKGMATVCVADGSALFKRLEDASCPSCKVNWVLIPAKEPEPGDLIVSDVEVMRRINAGENECVVTCGSCHKTFGIGKSFGGGVRVAPVYGGKP